MGGGLGGAFGQMIKRSLWCSWPAPIIRIAFEICHCSLQRALLQPARRVRSPCPAEVSGGVGGGLGGAEAYQACGGPGEGRSK